MGSQGMVVESNCGRNVVVEPSFTVIISSSDSSENCTQNPAKVWWRSGVGAYGVRFLGAIR